MATLARPSSPRSGFSLVHPFDSTPAAVLQARPDKAPIGRFGPFGGMGHDSLEQIH
jgi:hypothetical protein